MPTTLELAPLPITGTDRYDMELEGGYLNYDALLSSFPYENILQVDDSDYQGDSRVLFRDGQRIGYLNFGWGSCSGCDALQGCSTPQEVEELRRDLFHSIQWFDTATEALAWFTNHDWEGDYTWHQEEQALFVEEAKSLLAQMVEENG